MGTYFLWEEQSVNKIEESYNKNIIETLFRSNLKSRQFFFHQRWPNGIICPTCAGNNFYLSKDVKAGGRYVCRVCRFKIGLWYKTYLQGTKLNPKIVVRLIHQFVVGNSAKHATDCLPINVRSTERIFRLFRTVIYEDSLESLKILIKMNEIDNKFISEGAIYPTSHTERPNRWDIPFGIFEKSGMITTFPLSAQYRYKSRGDFKERSSWTDLFYEDLDSLISYLSQGFFSKFFSVVPSLNNLAMHVPNYRFAHPGTIPIDRWNCIDPKGRTGRETITDFKKYIARFLIIPSSIDYIIKYPSSVRYAYSINARILKELEFRFNFVNFRLSNAFKKMVKMLVVSNFRGNSLSSH